MLKHVNVIDELQPPLYLALNKVKAVKNQDHFINYKAAKLLKAVIRGTHTTNGDAPGLPHYPLEATFLNGHGKQKGMFTGI